MSEKKSEPKDRTALYIAIVGATATVIAALIGVLPNLLRNPPPTPVVITAAPAATVIAQATTLPPTVVAVMPTATEIAPTLVLSPTIGLSASPTPPPASPTPTNIVTLVLVNNLPRAMEFFVDGVSATSIDSGAYQVVPLKLGTHELKQCVYGSDTTKPENCFAKSAVLNNSLDYWEMFDAANPEPPSSPLTLLVLNQSSAPQDIYMDGIFAKTVGANTFIALRGPGGLHTIQPCPVGDNPASGKCGERRALELGKKVEIFRILGESS